jgi:CMP-N-acetylneuraminic acid synthetase|tara:strand:- start:2542 stop:3300 length:759 start_codon:yes stop_codon:yes gene_type:complete
MKHTDVHVVALIPAKTDSTRLTKKNLQKVNGKTLLEHSIDYALSSEYIKDIIVSTESDEVRKICETYDILENDFDNTELGSSILTQHIHVYNRPKSLLRDAEVSDVYVDIFQNQFTENSEWGIPQNATHVVALQPDHPDRTKNLDEMIDYFIDNTYDDLITVDSSGTRNGSVRITKAQYVMEGTISRRIGSVLDDCTNIHSNEDLKRAESNMSITKNNQEFKTQEEQVVEEHRLYPFEKEGSYSFNGGDNNE